jgi:hypothetical protein
MSRASGIATASRTRFFKTDSLKGWHMTMTPQQIIDRVVSLERELADFYTNLQSEPHLKPLEKIFRFMARHSAIHAELIANYRTDASIPQLEIDPLKTLHDRLKAGLREELSKSDDIHEAARKLSRAEEVIGLAYDRIADHYAHVSDTYGKIAGKFKALAEDERNHRDYILRENEGLKP